MPMLLVEANAEEAGDCEGIKLGDAELEGEGLPPRPLRIAGEPVAPLGGDAVLPPMPLALRRALPEALALGSCELDKDGEADSEREAIGEREP